MDNLRIALFASEYPPHIYGGLGTHVHAITVAHAAQGTSVALYVPRQDGYEPVPPGVTLHQVPVGRASSNDDLWLRFCQTASDMARQLRGGVDVIHCHDWMTAPVGIILRGYLSVPLVFNVHLPQAGSLNLAMENLGLIWGDCVLVNSCAVARELAHRCVPIRSMCVIPNGVDVARFLPAEISSDGNYNILFVGRLVPQKGVDVVVRAFGVALDRCPDIRLVVAGNGDQALYLERLARHLGISAHVSFVGWQRGQDLVTLYQQARIVVIPSVYEPFGIVALEAMACGRPVVASRTGGLEEVVKHGVTGYLVRPADHLELAQRLVALHSDPVLAAQFGHAARQRALGFTWEKIAERIQRVYRTVIGQDLDQPYADSTRLIEEFIHNVHSSLRPLADRLVSAIKGSFGDERPDG